MYKADSNVKMYAWSRPKINSSMNISNDSKIDIGAITYDFAMKIMDIKLMRMICPPVTLANKRIRSVKGFVNMLMISMGTRMIFKTAGTPGTTNMWRQ